MKIITLILHSTTAHLPNLRILQQTKAALLIRTPPSLHPMNRNIMANLFINVFSGSIHINTFDYLIEDNKNIVSFLTKSRSAIKMYLNIKGKWSNSTTTQKSNSIPTMFICDNKSDNNNESENYINIPAVNIPKSKRPHFQHKCDSLSSREPSKAILRMHLP